MIITFLKFLRRSVDGRHLMRFQSYTSDFNYLQHIPGCGRNLSLRKIHLLYKNWKRFSWTRALDATLISFSLLKPSVPLNGRNLGQDMCINKVSFLHAHKRKVARNTKTRDPWTKIFIDSPLGFFL